MVDDLARVVIPRHTDGAYALEDLRRILRGRILRVRVLVLAVRGGRIRPRADEGVVDTAGRRTEAGQIEAQKFAEPIKRNCLRLLGWKILIFLSLV